MSCAGGALRAGIFIIVGVLASTMLVRPEAGAATFDAARPRLAVTPAAHPLAVDAKHDRQPSPRPNVSPAQAARSARRQYGGRVLNVVLVEGAGAPYYRVKLLARGRVRIVHIEAHR